MWSLGCILLELHVGKPLFDGANEYEQVSKQAEVLGLPPDSLISGSRKGHTFFKLDPETNTWTLRSGARPGSRPLSQALGPRYKENNRECRLFLDLLLRMLDYRPDKRIKPLPALQHAFFNPKAAAPSGLGSPSVPYSPKVAPLFSRLQLQFPGGRNSGTAAAHGSHPFSVGPAAGIGSSAPSSSSTPSHHTGPVRPRHDLHISTSLPPALSDASYVSARSLSGLESASSGCSGGSAGGRQSRSPRSPRLRLRISKRHQPYKPSSRRRSRSQPRVKAYASNTSPVCSDNCTPPLARCGAVRRPSSSISLDGSALEAAKLSYSCPQPTRNHQHFKDSPAMVFAPSVFRPCIRACTPDPAVVAFLPGFDFLQGVAEPSFAKPFESIQEGFDKEPDEECQDPPPFSLDSSLPLPPA